MLLGGGVEAGIGVRDRYATEDLDHASSRDFSRLGSFPHQFPHYTANAPTERAPLRYFPSGSERADGQNRTDDQLFTKQLLYP
jgi:hypothetical protein